MYTCVSLVVQITMIIYPLNLRISRMGIWTRWKCGDRFETKGYGKKANDEKKVNHNSYNNYDFS
jgi:hypothetical protein